MHLHTPTHLIIILRPDHEEHTLFLLGDILSEKSFTILNRQEETGVSKLAEPFTLSYQQKRLTLALSIALTPEHLKEIAELVATGLLLGFLVEGEINLGEYVINTLGGFEQQRSASEETEPSFL